MAGCLLNSDSFATSGPLETITRPSRPSDSHVTSDPGPPDRNPDVGGAVLGRTSSLADAKVLLSAFIEYFATTPLRMNTVSSATTSRPATAATRGGAIFLSCRTSHVTRLAHACPITINSTKTSTAKIAMIGYAVQVRFSTPIRLRISVCHREYQYSITTVPMIAIKPNAIQ